MGRGKICGLHAAAECVGGGCRWWGMRPPVPEMGAALDVTIPCAWLPYICLRISSLDFTT